MNRELLYCDLSTARHYLMGAADVTLEDATAALCNVISSLEAFELRLEAIEERLQALEASGDRRDG